MDAWKKQVIKLFSSLIRYSKTEKNTIEFVNWNIDNHLRHFVLPRTDPFNKVFLKIIFTMYGSMYNIFVFFRTKYRQF